MGKHKRQRLHRRERRKAKLSGFRRPGRVKFTGRVGHGANTDSASAAGGGGSGRISKKKKAKKAGKRKTGIKGFFK